MIDKKTQLAWLDKQRSIVNDMIVNLPPDEQRKLLPELQVINAIAERVRDMSAVEFLNARDEMTAGTRKDRVRVIKSIFQSGHDNKLAVEIVRRWKEEQDA